MSVLTISISVYSNMLVEGERGMFSKGTQLGAPKAMFYYDFVLCVEIL